MTLRTTFLWSMIVSLATAAALGVIAILFEDLGAGTENVLLTSLVVGVYSMVCLVCAYILDRRRARAIMWIGIVASALALITWLVFIWADAWRWSSPWDELLAKFGAVTSVLCVWSAHFGLMTVLVLRATPWRIVRWTTLALGATLAASLILLIVFEGFDNDWTWRLIAVLSIVTVSGSVISPVLMVIERVRARAEPTSIERRVRVTLQCPRCSAKQTIDTGSARCTACGLGIAIKLDEPRCWCGYPLYNLHTETCPECGRTIPEEDRWNVGTE